MKSNNQGKKHGAGIQLKLSLMVAVLSTVILSVFGLYSIKTSLNNKLEKLEKNAELTAMRMKSTLAYPVWNYNDPMVNEVLEGELRQKNFYAAYVFSARSGKILYAKKKNADWEIESSKKKLDDDEKKKLFEKSIELKHKGEHLANLSLYVTDKFIREEMFFDIITTIIKVLLIDIAIVLGISLSLSAIAVKPIRTLEDGVRKIGEGDFSHKIKINSKDEFLVLADSINMMTAQISELQQQAVVNAQVQKEMEIAKGIQTSLVPDVMKMKLKGYDLSANMTPAAEVGGDYYDVIEGPNGHLWFAIGDVTGHGLIPGLVMMMSQVLVNTYVRNSEGQDPVDILVKTNKIMQMNIRERMNENHHMTFSLLVDKGDGDIAYAGAHEKIVIYRKAEDKVEVIDTDGMWLGIIPDIQEATAECAGEFKLNPGDICALYTDGVIEIMNDQREQYDIKRVADVIRSSATLSSAEIKQKLLDDINEFKHEQLDDITFIVMKKV